MFHQNQLQFNLDVPSLPGNLAARYRHPGPLVIEKLGGGGSPDPESAPAKPKDPPIKFTALSEDRLSTAVRLARLDLKNILSKGRTPDVDKPGARSKSKRSPSSGKLQRYLHGYDTNIRLRERFTDPNKRQQSVETQTRRAQRRATCKDVVVLRPVNSNGLILNAERRQPGDASKRGGASPPSREVALSPNSRQAQEIRRLRSELKTYMKQVEELSIKASRQSQEAAQKAPEEAEEDPRRAARAAEHSSRSARLLYSLQQQVREIQEELDKLGPGKVRHTKKSRALHRLAAAHRGAVRALQSFLHHLPAQVDHPAGGLPPHYQELALLLQQLSLCCSQLDVEGSGIPDGVLSILEQAKDFQDALSHQLSSPPRPKPNRAAPGHQPSPRRRLAFETVKPATRARESKPQQVDQRRAGTTAVNPHHYRVRETPVRDTDPARATPYTTPHTAPHTAPNTTPGPATAERLRQTVVNNKATPGSPERNAALRAGLEALLRAGGPAQGPAHPIQPAATKRPHQRHDGKTRRRPPTKGLAAPSKSCILPAQLKAARERLQRAPTVPRDAHFAQETVVSKLKHRDPAGRSTSGAVGPGRGPQEDGVARPAWTPPGSPRSFHRVPPGARHVSASSVDEDASTDQEHSQRRRVVFNLDAESHDEKGSSRDEARRPDPDLMEREIARQAWLDREAAQQLRYLGRGQDPDGQPPVPPHWLEEVKQAVTDRLRPLIDKAEATANEQHRIQHSTKQSLHHQLSQKAARATSNNAELLSDLLLDDILADTALEFHRMERDEELDWQARRLVEAPTVEGMLQSLEKMELMEDEIRRRWKRVEYIDQEELGGDSMQQREAKWMMGTPLSGEFLESFPGDVPTSHTSMQFTRPHLQDDRQSHPSVSAIKPPYDMKTLANGDDDRDNGVRFDDEHKVQIFETDTRGTTAEALGDSSERAANQTRHVNILHTLLDGNKSGTTAAVGPATASDRKESGARPAPDRPQFPLFVASDAMGRIRDQKARFERHLKRTSHWAYGTFDPWRLVEEVSDEIVSEIIKDVSSEVGDIMSHCVDDLYQAEFDMT